MLKSEESQACRARLIHFTQKVNEWLNVCDTADPTLKTDLETHGKLHFFSGTCIVKIQYLNCTCNWNDLMVLDGNIDGCFSVEDLRNQETVSPWWSVFRTLSKCLTPVKYKQASCFFFQSSQCVEGTRTKKKKKRIKSELNNVLVWNSWHFFLCFLACLAVGELSKCCWGEQFTNYILLGVIGRKGEANCCSSDWTVLFCGFFLLRMLSSESFGRHTGR